MNDRKPIENSSPDLTENSLVKDFCQDLKSLRWRVQASQRSRDQAVEQGIELFQILIERNGYPLERDNQNFWDDVRKRLQRYFEVSKDNFAWLTKLAEDNEIDVWVETQLDRYKKELPAPEPVTPTRGGIASRILRFL